MGGGKKKELRRRELAGMNWKDCLLKCLESTPEKAKKNPKKGKKKTQEKFRKKSDGGPEASRI